MNMEVAMLSGFWGAEEKNRKWPRARASCLAPSIVEFYHFVSTLQNPRPSFKQFGKPRIWERKDGVLYLHAARRTNPEALEAF